MEEDENKNLTPETLEEAIEESNELRAEALLGGKATKEVKELFSITKHGTNLKREAGGIYTFPARHTATGLVEKETLLESELLYWHTQYLLNKLKEDYQDVPEYVREQFNKWQQENR